ncbi:hypothetical protein AABB24_001021 [Solanum stoloniferum]|uniref:Uncharacterized protein n=1 Tax=Solanum stoloniferum TaxID=62892 RepID=A0ABD2VKF9_9SOLN
MDLMEGSTSSSKPEGSSSAKKKKKVDIDQIKKKNEELLKEMEAIKEWMMAADEVFVQVQNDIDEVVSISQKKGHCDGLVKVRPANSLAKSYIKYQLKDEGLDYDKYKLY